MNSRKFKKYRKKKKISKRLRGGMKKTLDTPLRTPRRHQNIKNYIQTPVNCAKCNGLGHYYEFIDGNTGLPDWEICDLCGNPNNLPKPPSIPEFPSPPVSKTIRVTPS